MEKQPEEMTVCNLEVLVMPNGDVLCKGETIGCFETLRKYLEEK